MKRSPLRRTSTLKRSPRRRKRGSTKYAKRERDFDYMGFIKGQPCAVGYNHQPAYDEFWRGLYVDEHCGTIEAHHAGVRGVGQKAPDDTCIPLCSEHHRKLGERCGLFSGWPRGAVKLWELAVIAHYQALYAARSSSTTDLF